MNNTIDYNGIQITLTPEQLAHIENETKRNKYKGYTDIKSFEDACEKLGLKPIKVLCNIEDNHLIVYTKLMVITKALNNGWLPNWDDLTECKYWNYFSMDGGFSSYSTAYHSTKTGVPSALCFKSMVIVEYAAKQFIDLYREYYNYNY